jgi:hypothetical protein
MVLMRMPCSTTLKMAKNSSENTTKLKYLGMMLTNQNHIYGEINSRLNVGNACYHAVHNFVFLYAI